MENQEGSFPFLELCQSTPLGSKIDYTSEIMSPFLLENDYLLASTLPQHFQEDLQMLQNYFDLSPSHAFQPAHSDFSHLPSHAYTDCSTLLHLSDFPPDTAFGDNRPVQPQASAVAEISAAMEGILDGNMTSSFLGDDLCSIAAPQECNHEGFLGDDFSSQSGAPVSAESALQLSESMIMSTGVGTKVDSKSGGSISKNLFSERNRRRRLSGQLLALRALVPNITKMDKRSILVDALAYLKGIQEEMVLVQKEPRSAAPYSSKTSSSCYVGKEPRTPPAQTMPKKSQPKVKILVIDTEKIEETRFVIKIRCKGGAGSGGELWRMIESLGFDIIYIAIDRIKPMHLLTTVFIRVKKQGKMTEERLKDFITSAVLRSGLLLRDP